MPGLGMFLGRARVKLDAAVQSPPVHYAARRRTYMPSVRQSARRDEIEQPRRDQV